MKTGAASGIGLAVCEGFVAEGMRVVMADLNGELLQNEVDRLRDAGAEVDAVPPT